MTNLTTIDIKINGTTLSIEILTPRAVTLKYVGIVPVKLSLPFIKPRDEVYLLGSNRRGNRIVKKANPIGFIIKNRKNCSFYSPFCTNLCIETVEIIHNIIQRINCWDLYYDFKNNQWPNWLVQRINSKEEVGNIKNKMNDVKDKVSDIKTKLEEVKDKINQLDDRD